jgi:hypothetical protein
MQYEAHPRILVDVTGRQDASELWWVRTGSTLRQTLRLHFVILLIGFRRSFFLVTAVTVERIALIVAMVLPLKLLMILDSSRVPDYFPESLRALDLDEVAILVGAISLASYALHWVLKVFQPRLAEKAYKDSFEIIKVDFVSWGFHFMRLNSRRKLLGLSEAASGWVFSLFCLIFLGLSFQPVFWIYAFAGVVMFTWVALQDTDNHGQAETWRLIRKGPALEIAFLLSISVAIGSALSSIGPNLLVMMLSMLLLRQGLAALLRSGEFVARLVS